MGPNIDRGLSHVIILLGVAFAVPRHSEAQQAPRVWDSAGVRIVTHGELATVSAPFEIAKVSTVDFGGLRKNPDEELDSRNPFLVARPLSDGRWIVVDWAALKLFDGRGTFVRTVGRTGSGPGEFRQVRDVCVAPGDTLIAFEFSDRRISVFDSAGTHLRTALIEGRAGPNPCLGDGSILVRGEAAPNPRSKLSRQAAALMDRVAHVERVRWDGVRIGTLGALQVETLDLTFEEVGNIAAGPEHIYVGNGSEPEYRVYNSAGKLLQIVRWQARRTAVTTAMREAASRRGFAPGAAARDFLPVYGALVPGPDAVVWVQDYPLPRAKPPGYTVFDRNGFMLGRTEPPPVSSGRVIVQWIGTNRVALAWRDSDGGAHITVHAVTYP